MLAVSAPSATGGGHRIGSDTEQVFATTDQLIYDPEQH
jgi:hypothetical protein